MRSIAIVAVAALVAGCGSMEYRDTNRAVDANPLCAARPDRPGEPVASECERKAEASWSSESKRGEPIDFSGGDDDR